MRESQGNWVHVYQVDEIMTVETQVKKHGEPIAEPESSEERAVRRSEAVEIPARASGSASDVVGAVGPTGDAAYRVQLPLFEGPLDLLLHLIQQHELDILDIPISFITEKYLDYVRLMEDLNIDVAGDYLVMAMS